MTNKKWLGVGLAVTLMSGIVLTGCNDNKDTAQNGTPKTEDQTINLEISSEVPTLDSSKATDNLAFRALGQIEEGLVRLDKNDKAIPGVASSWDISKDGLQYTFHLRDNAKWWDGTPVTAHDFEYAWKRGLDPKTKSEYAFMLDWIKGGKDFNEGKTTTADKVGVTATDDKTLQVTLEYPIPFFLEQMAFPTFYPLKKDFVEQQGDKYGSDFDKVMGNGPFKVTAWTHEQNMELVKNDNYWDKDKVKLTKVNFQFVQDEAALENLYQTGGVDRIPLVSDQIDRYKTNSEFRTLPQLATGYLQFNSKIPALQNAKVRKALTYAVDAAKYADIVYHNGTVAATGYVPVGTSDGKGSDFRKDNGDLIDRSTNAANAKQLLQDGLKEQGLSTFPKLKLLYDDGAQSKKASEFVKEQWRQNLGIDVEIVTVPFKLKQKQSRSHDFDIVYSLWIGDYNDPMTFLDLWTSDSSFNDNGYKNSQYDQLVAAAKTELDPQKRLNDMLQAEKVLMNDMPIGPVFFRGNAILEKPYVKNLTEHPLTSPDYDLKETYIEGKK